MSHACLPQMALSPRRMCGHRPRTARQHHQSAEELGNRAFMGFGQCSLCGSFLDTQFERAETCSIAEATQGQNACVRAVLGAPQLADPGINRGNQRTHKQSRPDDLFTTAAFRGRSTALDVCVAFSNAAAARWRRSTSSILIVKTHITDDKFQTFGLKASTIALWFGLQTADHTHSRYPNTAFCRRHWSVPQRSAKVSQIPPAQVEARNSNSLRRTAAMTRAVRPHSSAREGFSADSWTELWVIGFGLRRLMGGTTTKTQTEEQTPQYQMTTARTFFPSPVHKPQPSRSQTCALLGAVCSLMYQLFLEIEALFEDHGVCSGVITDSLVLERAV